MDAGDVEHLHNAILFSCWEKKEIMKFAGKQMELETILSEVTQTQEDKVACFLSFVFAGFESLDMCVLFGTVLPLSSKMEVSLKRI